MLSIYLHEKRRIISMNRYFLTLFTLCTTLVAHAQIDRNTLKNGANIKFVPGSSLINTPSSAVKSAMPMGSSLIMKPVTEPSYSPNTLSNQSEQNGSNGIQAQPQDNYSTTTTTKRSNETTTTDDSYAYGGLHHGLNASVNFSVMAAFGKHAPQGVGFAQQLNATYLAPLGKRGWLAAGGYLQHLNWDGANITSGGLYAELGYRFNEHWAAYVYGQKSLVNNGLKGYPAYYASGMGYYGRGFGYYGTPYYNNIGDKIGAAIRWTPNPTFSVQLSVEKNWYPSGNYYEKQYDYPVPIR